MKVIQYITNMTESELAKLLFTYITKTQLVGKVVARNAGNPTLSAFFNESEVSSRANESVHKCLQQVANYRRELLSGKGQLAIMFEHAPLFIRYFKTSFDNTLRDMARSAKTQTRSRCQEVQLASDRSENADGALFEPTLAFACFDDVNNLERKTIVDHMRMVIKNETASLPSNRQTLILQAFECYFVARVTNERQTAQDLKLKSYDAQLVRADLAKIMKAHLSEEARELSALNAKVESYWDSGKESAKAANKASAKATRASKDADIVAADRACHVATVVRFRPIKNAPIKGQVEASVIIQIVRNAGGGKEVIATQAEITQIIPSMDAGAKFKKAVEKEVKAAEQVAALKASERRALADSIFSGEVA